MQWGNSDSINDIPKYLTTNHPGNTGVVLVNTGRLANSNVEVSHQGWVKTSNGKGFIKGVLVSGANSELVYSNTFLTFTGGSPTSPANASLVVNGTSNVSVVVNAPGEGFTSIPAVSASGANNTGLSFAVVPGGRIGRVQTEVLVALSNTSVTDANSGLPHFPGL